VARELRIEISDEAYAQLQRAAAAKNLSVEAYATQALDAELTRARFLAGARSFIDQHAAGLAERFGGPAPSPSAR
jgi:uncharacterized membrane protein